MYLLYPYDIILKSAKEKASEVVRHCLLII